MRLQLIIGHGKKGKKGHHILILNDGGPIQVATTMFTTTQAWALMLLLSVCDALPSPGVNPLEGSPKCSCGKLGLGRCSRLPAL